MKIALPQFFSRIAPNCWTKLLYTSFILLLLASCQQEKGSTKVKNQKAFAKDITIVPDTINFKDLSLDLQPKSILLSDRTPAVSVTVPLRSDMDTTPPHPLYPEIQMQPVEVITATHSSLTQNFSTEEGLEIDVISCSFADSKGNLWFGTYVGGLIKYDGRSFTAYSTSQGLIRNEVHVIKEDKNGDIWIGTLAGISKFDGVGFTTIGDFGHIMDMFQDANGSFWIAQYNGELINYLDGKTTRYSKENGYYSGRANSFLQDKLGNIWIGAENGLSIFNGKNFINKDDEIDALYKPINRMAISDNQQVWLSSDYGIIKIENEEYQYFPNNDNTSFRPSLFKDSFGNLWISERDKGLLKYDGTKFSSFNVSQGVASNHLNSLTEDQSGNLWFSNGAGISKYSGDAIKNFTREQGLADASIRGILEEENGDLWFAGNSVGLSHYDGEKFYNYGISQGLVASQFWSIEKDSKGNIWLGTDQFGLVKFDGTKFTIYGKENGLVDDRIYFIFCDENDSLYIGTGNGISIFDGESFTNFSEENGLIDNSVFSILKDSDGRFWFGTEDGVSCFDGKSFINYSGKNGPGDKDIKDIIEDEHGNFWFASYGQGLYRYDGKNFHQYTTKEGLPDNTITQIALSKEGYIVVGTNYGIAIIKGFSKSRISDDTEVIQLNREIDIEVQNKLLNSELAIYHPIFEIYNAHTGYPIKDVNRGQNGLLIDKDGVLWIATGSEKSGLVRFDYASLQRNERVPTNVLTSVLVSNKKMAWHNLLSEEAHEKIKRNSSYKLAPNIVEEVTSFGKVLTANRRNEMMEDFSGVRFDSISPFYPIPQNLVLPYEHNNLTIEFTAIEPSKPRRVKYQYWLEGYGNDWSTPKNQTSATFGNIFEGEYTFHLRSQSPSGIWSEQLDYTIRVLPPWFRTIWAYISYLVLFLAGLRIFSRFREKKLVAEKEKLELTVSERTEELSLEKKKSDDLLLNILPEEIANELKEKGKAEARDFDLVSIFFTDFKGFTAASEKLGAQDLVREINTCFVAFDSIIAKYNVEKIKTIGDAYMAAGGLPVPTNNSVKNTVLAALELQTFISKRKVELEAEGQPAFEMRVGVHTGPVVAGIVGVKKFQYDIWGDTVNTASRMESSGEVGKVNISQTTYDLLKDQPEFNFESRGKIEAKGKGEMEMYFVTESGEK